MLKGQGVQQELCTVYTAKGQGVQQELCTVYTAKGQGVHLLLLYLPVVPN